MVTHQNQDIACFQPEISARAAPGFFISDHGNDCHPGFTPQINFAQSFPSYPEVVSNQKGFHYPRFQKITDLLGKTPGRGSGAS